MATTPTLKEMRVKLTPSEWLAAAAFVISLLGTAFSVGVIYGQVQQNTRDIRRLDGVPEDVAEIKANVSFLTELAREQRGRQ